MPTGTPAPARCRAHRWSSATSVGRRRPGRGAAAGGDADRADDGLDRRRRCARPSSPLLRSSRNAAGNGDHGDRQSPERPVGVVRSREPWLDPSVPGDRYGRSRRPPASEADRGERTRAAFGRDRAGTGRRRGDPAQLGDDRRRRAAPRPAGSAGRGAGPAPGTGCRSRPASGRAGTSAAAAWTSAALLNVTMPEKLTKAPQVEAPAGLVGAAGEAVEDRARRHALGGEDVERVVPRLAGVDHERQPCARGRAGSGRRTRRAGRRGASGRSSSRARTRRRRRRAGASSRSTIVSTPLRASCGCSPTVAYTPSWSAATSIAASDVARSHPTVTIVATPAAARRRRRPPCRPGSGRRGRGSASRTSRPASARHRDAREQRVALGHRERRRGSRPTRRPPGRRWSATSPVEADALPDRLRRAGIAGRGEDRRRSAAPRGRRRARRRRPGRARPSTARWPRGRRWSPGSAATSRRGRGSGATTSHAARGAGVRRRPRRRPAGCRRSAPGRCRRTSCRPRWRRGRARLPRLLARSAL